MIKLHARSSWQVAPERPPSREREPPPRSGRPRLGVGRISVPQARDPQNRFPRSHRRRRSPHRPLQVPDGVTPRSCSDRAGQIKRTTLNTRRSGWSAPEATPSHRALWIAPSLVGHRARKDLSGASSFSLAQVPAIIGATHRAQCDGAESGGGSRRSGHDGGWSPMGGAPKRDGRGGQMGRQRSQLSGRCLSKLTDSGRNDTQPRSFQS